MRVWCSPPVCHSNLLGAVFTAVACLGAEDEITHLLLKLCSAWTVRSRPHLACTLECCWLTAAMLCLTQLQKRVRFWTIF